jgi:hypothetical protein
MQIGLADEPADRCRDTQIGLHARAGSADLEAGGPAGADAQRQRVLDRNTLGLVARRQSFGQPADRPAAPARIQQQRRRRVGIGDRVARAHPRLVSS